MEFRAAYGNVGMGVHILHHRAEPAFAGFQVRVQQNYVLRVAVLEQDVQSPVVTFRKTVVPVQGNGPDMGELPAHKFQGSVAARVVGNDDLGIKPLRPRNQGRQETLQVRPCVPVQYDYGRLQVLCYLQPQLPSSHPHPQPSPQPPSPQEPPQWQL